MKKVKLNNGIEMPILGFGVYQIPEYEQCKKAVLDAIEVGYRSFDTAQAYNNEEAVGDAIKESNIPREEFFITSKIWVSNGGYEKAKASITETLGKMKLTYIDLMLIHQPFNDYYGSYRALEEGYKTGIIKAIGVSNFYPDRYIDLINFTEIIPAINQVETHVFNQQSRSIEIMKKYGTQIESWGPFAEGKNDFFDNEILKTIGQKHGKSVAQVALHFLVQKDIVVIPKSTHKERMKENFEIFDFQLSDEDTKTIEALDKRESLFFSHYDPELVEFIISYAKK